MALSSFRPRKTVARTSHLPPTRTLFWHRLIDYLFKTNNVRTENTQHPSPCGRWKEIAGLGLHVAVSKEIPLRFHHLLDNQTTTSLDTQIFGLFNANTTRKGRAPQVIHVRTSTAATPRCPAIPPLRAIPNQFGNLPETLHHSTLQAPSVSASISWRKEPVNTATNANFHTSSPTTTAKGRYRLMNGPKPSCSSSRD